MATVGTRNVCNTTNLCGGANLVGQGSYPELWVQYSTDDASDTDPLWVDATAAVRAFSIDRGRNSELDEVDAGTATLALDNRDRTFDPTVNTAIRPLNQWRILSQFSGVTESRFVGYAESIDQQWPGTVDAVAVVSLVDEFKVLALDRLPTMSPPRDTYADLIGFDNPHGFWRMNEESTAEVATATIGKNLALAPGSGSLSLGAPSPIVGDPDGYVSLAGGAVLYTEVNEAESSDVTGLPEFTLELWFRFSAAPGATRDIVTGPGANAANTYVLKLLTTGALQIEARNSVGTNHTTASTALDANTWYHVVGTITAGTLRLYINGVQVTSSAWTGSFHGTLNTPASLNVGTSAGSDTHDFDELATYRQGLPASRILAHYTAGALRGFPTEQAPTDRCGDVLNAAGSIAPRRLDTAASQRQMTAQFMTGQSPLDELRRATQAETPDGLLFVARDGAIAFLANTHRGDPPYDTIQATFGDAGGSELPYTDLDVEYSEAFLFNEWHVTQIKGELEIASDATSIARYFKRSRSLTDMPWTTDGTAGTVALLMLAKYKDPFQRINSLTVTTADAEVAEAVLGMDIGDRIRVLRTPPGVGARIDEELFVQKISEASISNTKIWRITLGVSPL